jgi:hypothetical protein
LAAYAPRSSNLDLRNFNVAVKAIVPMSIPRLLKVEGGKSDEND